MCDWSPTCNLAKVCLLLFCNPKWFGLINIIVEQIQYSMKATLFMFFLLTHQIVWLPNIFAQFVGLFSKMGNSPQQAIFLQTF